LVVRLALAGFLIAHGTIHALFLAPRPPAKPGASPWPFDLAGSWIFGRIGTSPRVVSLVGLALISATLGGYALAAVATLGILPAGAWDPTVAIGSFASLVLLLLFFHRSLVVGMAIDVILLWVALVATWTPDLIG
jgi:hypothetical protein